MEKCIKFGECFRCDLSVTVESFRVNVLSKSSLMHLSTKARNSLILNNMLLFAFVPKRNSIESENLLKKKQSNEEFTDLLTLVFM